MSHLFRPIHALLAVILFIVIATGQQGAKQYLTVQMLDSPAAPGSGEPNLYASADGRVYLSWTERSDEERRSLRFAVRSGSSNWSEPRTIAEGVNWFVNWADFPSLVALPDGALAAHWLVKSSPDRYAYDINISRSTDRGKTWSKPTLPHRDGTKTEHGFVSMLPWDSGRVAAVWLDGRNFKDSQKGHGSSANEMTLRYTTIDAKGKVSEDAVLDPRVCECCQTSAALTSEGAIVAYRDRSEKEIRDISVVRLSKGRWTEPRTVNADGWEIHGCPVNGPSVSADGNRVAVAWFTAAKETRRVNVVFSGDAGATFAPPIQVDEGSPVGRVDILLLTDGSALVSWLERTTKGGEVKVRRITPNGLRDEAITVAESSAARSSGFPQMARTGNEIIFAWTDPGSPSRVRTAVGRFVAGK